MVAIVQFREEIPENESTKKKLTPQLWIFHKKVATLLVLGRHLFIPTSPPTSHVPEKSGTSPEMEANPMSCKKRVSLNGIRVAAALLTLFARHTCSGPRNRLLPLTRDRESGQP